MFTDTNKSKPETETTFTSTEIVDQRIDVPETHRQPNSPRISDGLLSIASSTLFNSEECKKIINSCIEELWTPVKTFGTGKIHQATMQRVRGNLSEHPFALFKEAIVTANSQLYNFELLGIIDTDYPQVARYKKGDFYHYHSEINPIASTRKLSFIVMLNDAEEYEGGEIEFLNTELDHSETSKIGTIIVFPSFLTYRIKPIKKGIRYFITGSIHGDSFK